MDILGKAGHAVGDAVAKAKERERVRLEDRLQLIDGLAEIAQELVILRKYRLGYSWRHQSEAKALKLIATAAMIQDTPLAEKVDSLIGIEIPSEGKDPSKELDAAYRALVTRLA